jgi:hypothetical protein
MMVTIGSAPEIAQFVQKQLSNYTYTFPNGGNVVRRSQPYRNDWIITAIRDLYFTGGASCLATKYDHLFPIHEGDDGRASREVPIPMVALVATAMYAALREWRTGMHQKLEFSATAYMDVYLGHVGTFKHILEQRERAFHVMMSHIYSRASVGPGPEASTITIADLDLDTLE